MTFWFILTTPPTGPGKKPAPLRHSTQSHTPSRPTHHVASARTSPSPAEGYITYPGRAHRCEGCCVWDIFRLECAQHLPNDLI